MMPPAALVNILDRIVRQIGRPPNTIMSSLMMFVQGWNEADETFNVTLELVKRGYTEAEILWSGTYCA